MKWSLHKTLEQLNKHLIEERDRSPLCVVCSEPLFNSEQEILDYLDYLEFEKQVIDYSTKNNACRDIYYVYPYSSNPIVRHHISYADDICVPVCHVCHGKIHGRAHKELEDLQPDMKKPCNDRWLDER